MLSSALGPLCAVCLLYVCRQRRARRVVCNIGGDDLAHCRLLIHFCCRLRGGLFSAQPSPLGRIPRGSRSETPEDRGCAHAREGLGLDAPSLSSLVERERDHSPGERKREGSGRCRTSSSLTPTSDTGRRRSARAQGKGGLPRPQTPGKQARARQRETLHAVSLKHLKHPRTETGGDLHHSEVELARTSEWTAAVASV